jgi:hypothetical protein
MRADRLSLGALLLLVAGFAAGIGFLARERYTRGDGYPAGSSYRTDPLGSRALHDALGEIDGVTVRRHTGPASRLTGGPGTTVLLLAAGDGLGSADPDLVRAAEAIALGGGRLVVSLPARAAHWYDEDEDDDDDTADEAGTARDGDDVPRQEEKKEANAPGKEQDAKPWPFQPAKPKAPPLSARWGFSLLPCPRQLDPTDPAIPVESIGIEEDLPWRGGDCLEALSEPWRPLYTRQGHVAAAERPLGRGTLVLLADGYVLSNEALLFDPRPGAIALFIGPARTILFEESHHGVVERPGVAALVGRYHLRGALAILALLFALWVWWAAAPLVPAEGAGAGAASRAGREASAGLLSLLRRGVPAKRLMAACVEEWRKAFAPSRPAAAEALLRMTIDGNDLPEIYRRARETVNPRGGPMHAEAEDDAR